MKDEVKKAPVICEGCERVFYGGVNAFVCPECAEKIQKRMKQLAKRETERDRKKRKGRC